MFVTFKIQIRPVGDKERVNEVLSTLDRWRRTSRAMANQVILHRLLQVHVADMIYLNEGTKAKLDQNSENGLLNTSLRNSTYRLLKGNDLPSDIISCVNARASRDYQVAAGEVAKGTRRIPFYKNNLPVPFSAASISFYTMKDKRRMFMFRVFKMDFACVLGKDKAGYYYRLQKIVDEGAPFGNPSFFYDYGLKKWFLLLPLPIEVAAPEVDSSRVCQVTLGTEQPILADFEGKEVRIGSLEEFRYRRIRIDEALRRLQVASRFSKGGKGRAHKLSALSRYHEKERRFTHDQLHKYSRALIGQCVRRGFGTIVLRLEEEMTEESKRFWSPAELREMIVYKAGMAGIGVTGPPIPDAIKG